MSILTHSPAIVRDGLVLCLDAGAVRSYPGNLVTNGAFDADSDWTKGTNWTIGSGAASHTAGSASYLTQAVGKLVEGKSYVCTYTISSYSAGDVRLVLGGTNGTYRGVTGGAQTWRETLTCGSTDSNVKFYGHTAFVGSIDNVIVQEATWSDLSGNLNNGTLVNEPVFSAESGAGGTRSFDFDGSSDYMNLGAGSSLNFGTGGVTMDAWVKTTQSSEGQILRVSYTSPYVLFGVASGKLRAAIHDGTTGANDENSNGPTVNDGDWHHVAAVFNRGGNIVFYKDAVATTGVSMSSVTDSIGAPNPYAAISRRPNSDSQYFDGKITCVRAYNRALTAAEIQQNYRTHKGRFGR